MQKKTTAMRLKCPHCTAHARIRYSEQITELYREGVIECQNIQCGWRGKFAVEFRFTMTPSLMPNANINLPLSPHVKREDIISQLQP